ncbi:MAG: hypothetical protein AAF960_25905 [Bacteroidota bacterium]
MTKKEENSPLGFGEISTIRNILMGQQMQEYDGRFESVQESLNVLEAAFNEKLSHLEKNTENRLQELQNDMSERFDKLEQLLVSNVEDLHKKVDKVTGDDRQKMGQLFAEMSKRLLE